jgi:hypothetical protein
VLAVMPVRELSGVAGPDSGANQSEMPRGGR